MAIPNNDSLGLKLAGSAKPLPIGQMLFKYSKYWHEWSRVLSPMDATGDGSMIEVSITSHGNAGFQLERCRALNIRIHGTRDWHGIGRDDNIYVSELPPEVMQEVLDVHGDSGAHIVFDPNLLQRIDLDLARRLSNGGTPFEKCKKALPTVGEQA